MYFMRISCVKLMLLAAILIFTLRENRHVISKVLSMSFYLIYCIAYFCYNLA
jgi:hypothetical protein